MILVDCQPSSGSHHQRAGLRHSVLIPLECEYFALRGVALLMDTIDKVRDRLNPQLASTASWPPCTTRARYTPVRSAPGWSRRSASCVFDATINRTVRFPETTVAGEPITRWARNSAARWPTASWPAK